MTCAPKSASRAALNGAAIMVEISSTRNPASGPNGVPSSAFRVPRSVSIVEVPPLQSAKRANAERANAGCYPPGHMPRMRLLIAGLVVLAVVGLVLTNVVAARARARQRSDWFEGKNLTLAP